ncbi:MAG: hypothetical protein II620_02100, partial [Paludibacteraceae bacterium]|nr:hypothetical protein [Paludibacteraceae bacterium]
MKISNLLNMRLTWMALLLSAVNLVFFHVPFFRVVAENVEADFNGVAITASMVLIMLAANFLAFYLILYLCRVVGKALMSTLFI